MIAHARTTDPDTSHAAAHSVGDLRLSQAAVLKVMEGIGACTDEWLVFSYPAYRDTFDLPPQSPSGIRSRRAELVRLGLVEYAEEKRVMSTGRSARVWRLRRN